MPTISLCMIVKNEEKTLQRCLDSVKDIVDEIVIIDTGSIDNTKNIAIKYTDKIYDFNWINDFSAARNYSYDKATMDYVLWLDADDVILPADRAKFIELINSLDPSVDIVMMKYNAAFDEQGNAALSYLRERLSKRAGKFRWQEPVHEYLPVEGNILISDICITHLREHPPLPGRNLAIYEDIISQGKELTPRGLFYYARELKDNGKYDAAIEYFNKFLNSGQGWVEDNINACYELAKCYKEKADYKKSLTTMLKSFEYDIPRAEACCQIGYYFKTIESYEQALFWFDLATKLPKNSWGFIQEDYWGFIPCIELCVCYYKLGKIEEAIKYNNKAAEYKPNYPAVIYNKQFFERFNTNFVS